LDDASGVHTIEVSFIVQTEAVRIWILVLLFSLARTVSKHIISLG
jgi:hypothetical protein